jgi:hypothetical protein
MREILKDKDKKLRKFKGRLDSLEDFVNPEWWKYIFDSIYLKTDADVVMDDELTEKEVDIFLEIIKPKRMIEYLIWLVVKEGIQLNFIKEDIEKLKVLTYLNI